MSFIGVRGCFMCGAVSGCALNGDIEFNVAFTTVFDPGGNKIVTL